jgi:hypothetical protein
MTPLLSWKLSRLLPAAWKVVILDNSIAEWQVFADNKPAYEILKERQR